MELRPFKLHPSLFAMLTWYFLVNKFIFSCAHMQESRCQCVLFNFQHVFAHACTLSLCKEKEPSIRLHNHCQKTWIPLLIPTIPGKVYKTQYVPRIVGRYEKEPNPKLMSSSLVYDSIIFCTCIYTVTATTTTNKC